MNHYRLKKDLPTFKAGQTFHTDAQGNLWLDEGQEPNNHWLNEVMAYHYKTIERFPNILTDWFEEIVEPDPSYLIVKIQKLENSIKELDERLKTVEEITERLLGEDNDRIIGSIKRYEPGMPQRVIFERMKQDLREWIEKNDTRSIQTYIYTEPDGQRGVEFKDVNAMKKLNTRDDISLTIMGWPTIGLKDGATYTPEELLLTGEAGKE